MDSIFKCQSCNKTFSQRMEDKWQVAINKWNPKGVMVQECPFCKSVYMDCLNLDECLSHAVKLDKDKAWVK